MKAAIGAAALILLAGAATVGIARAPWRTDRAGGTGVGRARAGAGDTVSVRRLWSLGSGPQVWPGAQSPDGRYVAFTDWATGDLAVYDLRRHAARRLTNKGSWLQNGAEYAMGAAFSPDGQSIAYGWSNAASRFELRVIGLGGGPPRIVYHDAATSYAQPGGWSPDGRLILALLSRPDSTNQIVTVTSAGGAVTVLKTFDWREPLDLMYSPDGRWILYDFPPSEDAVQRDVFVLSADGSTNLPLEPGAADDRALGWAPDGRHVLFLSDRGGARSVWMVGVAEGRPQGDPVLVRPDVWRSEPVGLTRDGRLYYTVATGTRGVYVVTVDPASGRVAAPAALVARDAGWPVFSPDGRSVAYSERVPATQAITIHVRSLQSGEESRLSPGLHSLMFPRWSPDGRFLVGIGSDAKNRPSIYTVDMQTGAARRVLALNPPDSWAQFPAWSRDARTIFFVYLVGRPSLRALDVQSGEVRELYRSRPRAVVGNGLVVSPDGEQLAWVRSDSATRVSELVAMPAAGGEPRVLASLKPGEEPRPLAWTTEGLFCEVRTYSAGGPARPVQLWFLPPGGPPVRTELGSGGGRLQWLAVNPDGRRVAYTSTDASSELWVMEHIPPRP